MSASTLQVNSILESPSASGMPQFDLAKALRKHGAIETKNRLSHSPCAAQYMSAMAKQWELPFIVSYLPIPAPGHKPAATTASGTPWLAQVYVDTRARLLKSAPLSSWWVFASLLTFAGLSCILGAFYDDEIHNIRWGALSFPNVFDYIKFINSRDIHPPASYLFNRVTFDALGNWKAVQLINSVANAAAIACFHRSVVNKIAAPDRLLLTFTLATAVTSEMWGTSLRWNAYFNPLFLALYVIAFSPRTSVTVRAGILTLGTVLLFYTSYVAAAAAAVIWGTFLVISFRDLNRAKLLKLGAILSVGAIACLPQLYVLITVHLPVYAHGHSFSMLRAFGETAVTLAVGTAVFPIDYLPLLFIALLVPVCIFSVRSLLAAPHTAILVGGLFVGFVLLVVLRIGVEGRNAVFLYPIALTLIVIAIGRSPAWIHLPTAAALICVQSMSVYNFVLHQGTTKGSFNTPFLQAMDVIGGVSTSCPGRTYVFTHDPVFTYLLQRTGTVVASPYAPRVETIPVLKNDCVLMVLTYRGIIPISWYAQHIKPLPSDDFRETRTIYLGPDRFAKTKSWVADESFPMYYVTIGVYTTLRDTSLTSW